MPQTREPKHASKTRNPNPDPSSNSSSCALTLTLTLTLTPDPCLVLTLTLQVRLQPKSPSKRLAFSLSVQEISRVRGHRQPSTLCQSPTLCQPCTDHPSTLYQPSMEPSAG